MWASPDENVDPRGQGINMTAVCERSDPSIGL